MTFLTIRSEGAISQLLNDKEQSNFNSNMDNFNNGRVTPNSTTNQTVRTPRNQVNFMEELQNQLKSGKSLLRKKSLDKLSMQTMNQQDNKELLENLDYRANLEHIKQKSQLKKTTPVALPNNNNNNNTQSVPEWKQKLIEKKKQQQIQQIK